MNLVMYGSLLLILLGMALALPASGQIPELRMALTLTPGKVTRAA